jgi:hypothetical protein
VVNVLNMWAGTKARAPQAKVSVSGSVGYLDYINEVEAIVGAGARINQNTAVQNNDQNVSVTADTTMEIIHAAGIINLALSEQNVRANLKARKSGGGLSSPVSLFGNQAAALGWLRSNKVPKSLPGPSVN